MNWDNAYKWADEANENKDIESIEPRWAWDCGLKLDFDGGLLRVSSRFYQVGDNIFDGSVSFMIGDTMIFNREFSSRHIDILKDHVEKHVSSVTMNIGKLCLQNKSIFIEDSNDEQ